MSQTEAFTVNGTGARWIRPGEQSTQLGPHGAYLTRTAIELAEVPPRVVIRATALGMYELQVNGLLVREAGLYRPGWTDTTRRVQYQEYDVTGLLRPGTNVVGAELAPGWHGGRIGTDRGNFQRLTPPELLLVAVAGTADPEAVLLAATGEGWEWSASDITESDLYDGEIADRRQRLAGWTEPEASDLGRWERMELSAGTAARLVPQAGPVVRETATFPVEDIRWLDDGTAVADTGRNENGFVRVLVDAAAGTRVTVSYGELTDVDGHVYTENLRSARCRDVFRCAGGGPEELAPRFSFRSFRYAQISGLPGPDALVRAERAVIGTELERTGWFESSDPLLNEIYAAILTSTRANFVEVPTDCPQRDERLGWMGDALLFSPLAAYTYDISGLMSKWFDDVLDARTARGLFTDIAPRPPGRVMFRDREGAPAWADAGVVLPWLMYQRYGDREVLERMYPAMMTWLRAVHADNPDGIWRHGRGRDYGDWVPAGPDTSHDLFGTCWLYHSTRTAADVADALGSDDAAWLRERAGVVRDAFAGPVPRRGQRAGGRPGTGGLTGGRAPVRALGGRGDPDRLHPAAGLRPGRRRGRGPLRPAPGRTGGQGRRPAGDRIHRQRLPARRAGRVGPDRPGWPTAPAQRVPVAGLHDQPGRHLDLGALGRAPARRRPGLPDHELLQPLRAGIDVPLGHRRRVRPAARPRRPCLRGIHVRARRAGRPGLGVVPVRQPAR